MKILIIGCGAVAQCTLEFLIKRMLIAPTSITIIDCLDKRDAIASYIKDGVHFKQEKIDKNNFHILLSSYLKKGDACIELANEIDTIDILTWCLQAGVMYLNSCLNNWPTKEFIPLNTIYRRVKQLRDQGTYETSAIVAHGANPGLISSFAKKALIDMAEYILPGTSQPAALTTALAEQNFKQLAYELQIHTMHVSEYDTQTSMRKKQPDQFLNTWSVVEFINECTAPAEFAWGTFETCVPDHATIANNNLTTSKKAYEIMAQTWAPNQEFTGIAPAHEEAFSLADYLTIADQQHNIIYRPTIIFVYDPCAAAKESLKQYVTNKNSISTQRVMTTEIHKGSDTMGSLLLSTHQNWWTGSRMTTEESNRIMPGHNATIMQVAAGVLAAFTWMLKNPHKGLLFPEDLDHKEILQVAAPYLGTIISQPCTWTPTKKNLELFK